MPHDQRRHTQRVVAQIAAQFRTADAYIGHPDQRFAWFGSGCACCRITMVRGASQTNACIGVLLS